MKNEMQSMDYTALQPNKGLHADVKIPPPREAGITQEAPGRKLPAGSASARRPSLSQRSL